MPKLKPKPKLVPKLVRETVQVTLDADLYRAAIEILTSRSLTFEDLVRAHLRGFLNSYKALGLEDCINFGKYRDEKVITICRLDPSYIRWIIEQSVERPRFTFEVVQFLDCAEDN